MEQPHTSGSKPGQDEYETGEIVALCRMERGRLIIEEAAYLRLIAGPEGAMIAAAPITQGDDPDTVTIPGTGDHRLMDVMEECASSRSRFLRRLFGRPAPAMPPPESIGDLLARRHLG